MEERKSRFLAALGMTNLAFVGQGRFLAAHGMTSLGEEVTSCQTLGLEEGSPPSRFYVSVADKGDKVLWNQHLCKC